MSRVQLALNVGDLDAAIEHYTKMFGVGPAKVRDGYANFAVEILLSSLCSSLGMVSPELSIMWA